MPGDCAGRRGFVVRPDGVRCGRPVNQGKGVSMLGFGNRGVRWGASLILGMLPAVGSYVLFESALGRQDVLSAGGVETVGRVTAIDCYPNRNDSRSGRTRGTPEVDYVFDVGGMSYAGRGGSPTGRCSEHLVGKGIAVTYLPSSPAVSLPYDKRSIVPGHARVFLLCLAFALLLVFGIGANAILFELSRRRAGGA